MLVGLRAWRSLIGLYFLSTGPYSAALPTNINLVAEQDFVKASRTILVEFTFAL